jgi:hypothetical protein
VIRLPSVRHEPTADLLEEVNAAIDLLASGVIRRIVLAAFTGVEDIASGALAHAQRAGVAFALSSGENDAVTIHIGPREE